MERSCVQLKISELTPGDNLNIETLKNFYKIQKIIGIKTTISHRWYDECEPEIMIVYTGGYDEKDDFINKIMKEGVVSIN